MSESSKKSTGKIDPVSPGIQFNETTGERWTKVTKLINPLGYLAEAYANTLAYKIETKRLEVEIERINKQAEIAHNAIDKTFNLKMEELKQRRAALAAFYEITNNELERLHIDKKKVMDTAEFAFQQILKPELGLEEKRMFKDIAIEATKSLPKFGEQANESLKQIVETIPPVEISQKLLEM